MPAVIDRVACPKCGAQKGDRCPDAAPAHPARYEALWALNRRETTNVNDRSTP